MIKYIPFLFLLFLACGCSLKTPENQWQYKSTNAFNSYTKNFLSSKDLLAKNDLKRAIKHAKQSANLHQLAKIYLGACALNISVGTQDTCEKYTNIALLVENNALRSYYKLLTKHIKKQDIKYLNKNYRIFAHALINKDYAKAEKSIFHMQRNSSKILAMALLAKHVSYASLQEIINIASYQGQKKVVLFWLEESKKHVSNPNELNKINQKIKVLQ
ncbi:hypothetical protein JHD48_03190 [Sulfurimonas sp. SAG-AH-194-I05]|nr:hypothetical protein [Sulfurimonas sp. SAG-AH-194-I05]MDF1874738.1 hypothetical protein [Sulfurimonas sp. SAG-AH-194-I05]